MTRRLGQLQPWIAAVVGLLLGATSVALAAEIYPKKTTAKKKPPLTAQQIVVRLDQLVEQQQDLLQALADTKAEVETVKVRAMSIPSGICNSVISQ